MENLVLGSKDKVIVNERKARELLEKVRWPDGPICPHCVVVGKHYRVMPRKGSRSPVRDGVWKCRDCRKQFTVTVGTVFHGSKIPLSKWVTAIYLMGNSAKELNPHQLHKRLRLTYKSARLMVVRIVESRRQGALTRKLNSFLEAEGARVVRKRAERGARGSKRTTRAAKKTVSSKGKVASAVGGRSKGKGSKAAERGKRAVKKALASKGRASPGGGKRRKEASRRAPKKVAKRKP